jgi:molybdate transport system substrate-binding protein
MKSFLKVFLILAMLFTFSACGNTSFDTDKVTQNVETSPVVKVNLTVSAAASLKDAMNELKDVYIREAANVNIIYNFASAGSLQQQIENGADVDLFISAAQKQMDTLKDKGLLEDETNKNLLGNSLVLIVPKESALSVNFEELAGDKVKKLALGEPKSVPVGQYSDEVFRKLNIVEKVKEKSVYGKDVKEVLTWVETGNVDAGIVYETDAKVSQKVKKVAEAPEGSHKQIVYPASVIKASKNKEAAKSFLNFLSGEKGKAVFEKYGFKFLEK